MTDQSMNDKTQPSSLGIVLGTAHTQTGYQDDNQAQGPQDTALNNIGTEIDSPQTGAAADAEQLPNADFPQSQT